MNEKEKLIDIVEQIIKKPIERNQEVYDKTLTGDLGLTGVDFAYFVMEVSLEFGIDIHKEDLENYAFNTVNAVNRIIYERSCT